MHTCNLSTWEVEAGGLGVQSQRRLHSKTLPQKKKKGKKEKKLSVYDRISHGLILKIEWLLSALLFRDL
jgi:hypothetical protein